MINTGAIPFQMVAQAPNNPFLQMPNANQQQQVYGMNPNQQQQLYQQHQTIANPQGSASADECDSGSNSDGESQQVLYKNPDQVKQYFEDFLKIAQSVDPSNIQLNNVIEYYNISFKSLPTDEEMKTEISKMIQKYNSSSQKGQKKNWNDNETKILCWIVIKACALQNLDCRSIEDKIWDDIAKMMIGRTAENCKFKWLSLSKLNLQQIPWSNEEDQLLLSIIRDFNASNKGNKWSEICKELNSRSKKNVFRQGKQCRERWNNHLDPNINRGPWSDKEDLQLLKLILEKGKKWSDVSKELKSNRTENNVKNRFNSLIKKEKQSLEETKGKVEANMSENDIIQLLVKKYTTRISQGFTLSCKEEELQKDQIMTEAPVAFEKKEKVEKKKNILKDLVSSEMKTKQSQNTLSSGQINSMVLEDQSKSQQNGDSTQNTLGSDQQQQQLHSQQYQQQYQQYMAQQFNNQAMNPEAFSPNTFKNAFTAQTEQNQCTMSPGHSQHNTPLQSHNNQGLLQLFSANGRYMAANPQNAAAAQNQLMFQFNQQQQQGQQLFQQQQHKQVLENTQTFKIKNATDLLAQGDSLQNMNLAFFNPQTQELVEIDNQLLDEYTQNQVRMQLQQYTQNIKSSTSQLQTPQQTPQQSSQATFQMMFNQLSNQIAGNSSPQQYLYAKQSPNIMSNQNVSNLSQQQQQQLMSMMGNPISPQPNLFSIMQNVSPANSNFNTPNNTNNQADIRRINQMQQYSNFFMNNSIPQNQQFPGQAQMFMQGNQNAAFAKLN